MTDRNEYRCPGCADKVSSPDAYCGRPSCDVRALRAALEAARAEIGRMEDAAVDWMCAAKTARADAESRLALAEAALRAVVRVAEREGVSEAMQVEAFDAHAAAFDAAARGIPHPVTKSQLSQDSADSTGR